MLNNLSGMKKIWTLFYFFATMLIVCRQHTLMAQGGKKPVKPFNILFAISDDQSYPHASAYGQKTFRTPVFDSIAASGILFNNAFVAAPQCSPSRAAILTGRHIWQLEEAGTHASLFPKKFPVFTDVLENEGYFIGYTGKAWAPGNFANAGWTRNPVGPAYNAKLLSSLPTKGISKTDYAANFKIFLSEKPSDKPFFFWYGANEPHRNYEEGSGAAAGLTDEGLIVPPFLPNNQLVKNDMLDYALEIEWFDKQLGKMLQLLAEAGELEHTIIVVTADNGMPFPYAKANLQEYGIHVPLAICGPIVKGEQRTADDLVSLIDLAPTFLDIAGAKQFGGITGKTLMPILTLSDTGKISPADQYILAGRERHSHARPDNVGYPARAIRTRKYLYIENFKPNRWPMGDPAPLQQVSISDNANMKPILLGYEDIDDSPTKAFMAKSQSKLPELFSLGFEKRGHSELYDIETDPYCLHDLSSSADMQAIRTQLKNELEKKLIEQGDPRMTGNGDIFDSYPRFGLMRPFEGFKERGKYNPAFMNRNN